MRLLQHTSSTPINKKRKLFDRPRMSLYEDYWSPFLIVFYAWNIIEIPSLSVFTCPDVDRGHAASRTDTYVSVPCTDPKHPLTGAEAQEHVERANPSGKTDANLIDTLGSTNSSSNIVHLKPFSTSILSFLNWVIATVTKICTKDHSKPAHASSSPWIFTYFYSFKYHSRFQSDTIFSDRISCSFSRLQLERSCLGSRFERNRFSGQIY